MAAIFNRKKNPTKDKTCSKVSELWRDRKKLILHRYRMIFQCGVLSRLLLEAVWRLPQSSTTMTSVTLLAYSHHAPLYFLNNRLSQRLNPSWFITVQCNTVLNDLYSGAHSVQIGHSVRVMLIQLYYHCGVWCCWITLLYIPKRISCIMSCDTACR